jgi:hypothetical protein
MANLKLAVIAVDSAEEIALFRSWPERNRHHILGISENTGRGCCVDSFEIEVEDRAEAMPCESSGNLQPSGLIYGTWKERVIDDWLTSKADRRTRGWSQ